MKKIGVFGSTGSIGLSALEVIEKNGFGVFALTANENIELLASQIKRFKPRHVCVGSKPLADKLCGMIDGGVTVHNGPEGLCRVAETDGYDIMLNAIMGSAGIYPTISAIESGKSIALSNKESLVAAGGLIMNLALKHGVNILPIDSEHSAVWQCLRSGNRDAVDRVILTASGGPFFGKTRRELEHVTAEDALKHPNWSMGRKITVDSATLMNKGLEIIEAMWLFSMPVERIIPVIHRESIVHSAVEYGDGSVIAQLGAPDMRTPIQYALTYPQRVSNDFKRISLFGMNLSFQKPDYEAFPCLGLAIEAGKRGGLLPCALNAANEAAVSLFLDGKIPFLAIYDIIESVFLAYNAKADNYSLEDVRGADEWARNRARAEAAKRFI